MKDKPYVYLSTLHFTNARNFEFQFKDLILLFVQECEVLISKCVQQNSSGMKGSCLALHKEIMIKGQCAMC